MKSFCFAMLAMACGCTVSTHEIDADNRDKCTAAEKIGGDQDKKDAMVAKRTPWKCTIKHLGATRHLSAIESERFKKLFDEGEKAEFFRWLDR